MEIVRDSAPACAAGRGQDWGWASRSPIAMPPAASSTSLTDLAEQARLRAGKVGFPSEGRWPRGMEGRRRVRGWLGYHGVPAYPGGWAVLPERI